MITRPKSPPLKHRVDTVIKHRKPIKGVTFGMDSSFPGILRMGVEPNEPDSIAIASYPMFQPKLQCFLWVDSHPQHCVNRVRSSTAFKRKSKATLQRLAFSKCLSIRYAAEMELLLRELIEQSFPATRSNYQ